MARRGRLEVRSAVVLLFLSAACRDYEMPTESRGSALTSTATVLSISLPGFETVQRIAIGASTELSVEDRARVLEGAGGLSTISSVGAQETQIGPGARVGNVWSAGPVILHANTLVDGFIKTTAQVTETGTGISVAGPISIVPVSGSPSLTSWTVTFPPRGADVRLGSGQRQTLPPSGYGALAISSGGQATLSAGTYFFSSVEIQAGGKLVVDETGGPVFVYARISFTDDGVISHVAGDAGDFLVGFTGTTEVRLSGAFQGTLVAPSALVTLNPVAGGHRGSFFGKNIEVEDDVIVTHQTFRHWDAFQSPGCPTAFAVPGSAAPFGFCNGGNVPRLPPAIAPEESRQIRDGFRWADTKPVANFAPEGPTLWYARVYVEDKADLETLEELAIHWDTMPLFGVERDLAWAGMTGVTTSTFDGEGGFVFAVIPGPTYNLLREAALCSDPALAIQVFRAVVLWDVPVPDAKNADGSLSYTYLATQGFRYRGQPNCPDDQMNPDDPGTEGACDSPFLNPPAGGDPVLDAMKAATTGSGLGLACAPSGAGSSTLQQHWGFSIGKLVKRVVGAVHGVTKGLSDLTRKGLASVSRFFKGSTTLTVNLEVRNSDPGFGGANTLMLRAWGPKGGQPVPLPGVQVRAMQQISFSLRAHIPPIKVPGTSFSTPGIIVPIKGKIPFDSLSTGTADATGTAKIKVVKSSTTGICIRLQNDAAEFDDWVSVEERCSFKNPILSAQDLTGPRTITAPLADDLVNDLAQITESHTYLNDVMGYAPKRANILTGFFADHPPVSSGGLAYTPCFGYASTSAIIGAIGQRLGNFGGGWVANKLETYGRDAASYASEHLDAWAAAADKWAAARVQAAGTAAAQLVNAAEIAVDAARDTALAARTAAVAAAEAAATVTEAAKRLKRLPPGTSQAVLQQAQQALKDAVHALDDLNKASQQAAQASAVADAAALQAVQAAYDIAINTSAAAAATIAGDAARVAGSFITALTGAITNLTSAILPAVSGDVGFIVGAAIGQVADVVVGDVDMVLPSGTSTLSRGIASHEYGHFAFCDMGYRADPGKFSTAWVNIAADTVAGQILKQDRSKMEDVYFNEAIADFFAAQTAGGVNYFFPVDSLSPNVKGVWVDSMNWCRSVPGAPSAPLRCIEDNFGASFDAPPVPPLIPGTGTRKQIAGQFFDGMGNRLLLNEQVARVASIVHDVFDGVPPTATFAHPGNGTAWIADGTLPSPQAFRAPVPPFTSSAGFFATVGTLNDTPESPNPVIHEENVSVIGQAFPEIIGEWLRREPDDSVIPALRQDTFLLGLSQVMRNHKVPDGEMCRLYTLHQPDDVCPSWGPSGLVSPPPPPLFKCIPPSKLSKGQCFGNIIP